MLQCIRKSIVSSIHDLHALLTIICRQFEEKNLGQMKTVYPTAFNFRQEKNIPGLFDKRNKCHLTVECIVRKMRKRVQKRQRERERL
jgi:hypothetical protein